MQGFDAGGVAFHAVPSPAAAVAGQRPRASALARSQARPGAVVTTLRNQVVRITDEPTGALLSLLDGTRDRAAILEAFPGALDAVLRRCEVAELLHAALANVSRSDRGAGLNYRSGPLRPRAPLLMRS